MGKQFIIMDEGGSGHNFLAGTIKHCLYNIENEYTFDDYNAHKYFVDDDNVIITRNVQRISELLKNGKKTTILKISCYNTSDSHKRKCNHFFKNFAQWPFHFVQCYRFYSFYLDYCKENNTQSILQNDNTFLKLPKHILLELIKKDEYYFSQEEVSLINKYVDFKTVMYNTYGLLRFIREITETEPNTSLIKTVKNYHKAQLELETKYSEYYNFINK